MVLPLASVEEGSGSFVELRSRQVVALEAAGSNPVIHPHSRHRTYHRPAVLLLPAPSIIQGACHRRRKKRGRKMKRFIMNRGVALGGVFAAGMLVGSVSTRFGHAQDAPYVTRQVLKEGLNNLPG